MKMFVEPDDIYLHTGFVDFRKSINGLLTIIENELEVDVFTGRCLSSVIKSRTS